MKRLHFCQYSLKFGGKIKERSKFIQIVLRKKLQNLYYCNLQIRQLNCTSAIKTNKNV